MRWPMLGNVLATMLLATTATAQTLGWAVRMVDVQGTIENHTKAEEILDKGTIDGVTVTFNSDTTELHDIVNLEGGVGTYPNGIPYPGAVTGADDFAVRAWADVTIPAGTWTIGFGTDDGGAMTIPGIVFDDSLNNDSFDSDQIRFEGSRSHGWTVGVFSVDLPLDTTIDVTMHDRSGGDSFEIAVIDDEDVNPADPGFGWMLLGDGTFGWSVSNNETPTNPDAPELKAGDANQDLEFSQLDLVKVLGANTYLTGVAATWGSGDWDAAMAPSGPGTQGSPNPGNGTFDPIDIVAALQGGAYLTGPYAALAGDGSMGDTQTSLVYDAETGELRVDSPNDKDLTSINITSAGGMFLGGKPAILDGAFDNFAADNIFKATFGGSFGDISFGNVLPEGLTKGKVNADLSAVGSLAGGGDLGAVDLVYIPEPTTMILFCLGLAGTVSMRNRRRYGANDS